jgi:hypothetical protein
MAIYHHLRRLLPRQGNCAMYLIEADMNCPL